MRKYKVGDVVRNMTAGCRFVVEESDVSICNDKLNKDNYAIVGKNLGLCKHKLIEKVVVGRRKGIRGIFKTKGKLMRSPETGELTVVTKTPYCLDCYKGISLSEFKYIKESLKW